MGDHLQVAPRRGQDHCSSVNSRGCGDDCRGQEAGNNLHVEAHASAFLFPCCQYLSPGRRRNFHGAASAGAPWVVSVLFHPLSGWHWSCSLPLFPQALHPSNCPSSFLTLPCQLAAVLGAGSGCLRAGSWLSGRRGGRKGAVPCCRWGRLLVQATPVGANCSSPDSFVSVSTPHRACSGFARDLASAHFWPGNFTLFLQLGYSITE